MRIYLDNSIIGRLVDIARGVGPVEPRLREDMAVLPGLIELCRKRGYRLCISTDAQAEIARVEKADRRQALLQELQQFHLLSTSQAGDEALPLVEALRQFLLSKTRITRAEKKEALEWDARHLAWCRLAVCDVFLTTDYASIWAYRRALERLHGITVKRPVELYQEFATGQQQSRAKA